MSCWMVTVCWTLVLATAGMSYDPRVAAAAIVHAMNYLPFLCFLFRLLPLNLLFQTSDCCTHTRRYETSDLRSHPLLLQLIWQSFRHRSWLLHLHARKILGAARAWFLAGEKEFPMTVTRWVADKRTEIFKTCCSSSMCREAAVARSSTGKCCHFLSLKIFFHFTRIRTNLRWLCG